jgi:hypothetical protein
VGDLVARLPLGLPDGGRPGRLPHRGVQGIGFRA